LFTDLQRRLPLQTSMSTRFARFKSSRSENFWRSLAGSYANATFAETGSVTAIRVRITLPAAPLAKVAIEV